MITELMAIQLKDKNALEATLKNLTNAIGAIHNNQLFAVGLFNNSINSDIFYTWLEQLLILELPNNAVIVMDNARFHKRADIQKLIEEQGHTILWLPPYSPNFNPIEKTWGWLKKLRKEWWLDCIDSFFIFFGCVPLLYFFG